MAVAKPLPRVLRIGIATQGTIIGERLIPPGQGLSVGASSRCTFTLPDAGLPERLQLFVCRRGRYTVQVPALAAMKLARGGDVQRHRGPHRLVLTDTDKGRIDLGEVTILFQFLDAPPVPARPRSGRFRPRLLDEDDPLFLGFLSMFSAIAAVAMLYVSAQPPVEMVRFEELPDFFPTIQLAEVSPPDPEPAVAEPEPEPIDLASTAREKPEAPAPEGPAPGLTPEEHEIARAQRLLKKKASLLEQSALLRQIIRTNGESGGGVFSGEDGLSEDFQQALAGIPGEQSAAAGAPGPEIRRAGVVGGRGDAVLSPVQTGGPARKAAVAKAPRSRAPQTRNPTGSARPGPVKAPSNIQRTVRATMARGAAQIRACYEQQLKEHPTLSGRLVLGLSVYEGRPDETWIIENSLRNDALERCVLRAANRWQFPGVKGVELEVPFSLSPGE